MYLCEPISLKRRDIFPPFAYPQANTRTLQVKSVCQPRLVSAIQRQRVNNFNFRVFIHGVNVRRIKHLMSSTNNIFLFRMFK